MIVLNFQLIVTHHDSSHVMESLNNDAMSRWIVMVLHIGDELQNDLDND